MTKTQKLWLIVPWAVFILLAIGWVIYWHVVAGTAEGRIRAWMEQQNAQGAHVSIARIVRHGFPAMLRLELRNFDYTAARGGWRARSDRADLHIQPFNTNHVMVRVRAPIALTRSNGDVTNIGADALIGSLRMNGDALAQAGIEADNLTLDDPDEEGVLAVRKLVVNLRPDARRAGDYQLAIEARDLTLPRPVRSFEAFGLDAPLLRAAIVVEHGGALMNAEQDDPLGPWQDAGGRLRFEALEVNWGPLQANGTGFGGIDEERRLIGDLELPIERPGPIFSALANGPGVDSDARRALALLAASFNVTREGITLDVEAGGGWLRLEGLTVRPLPPVY